MVGIKQVSPTPPAWKTKIDVSQNGADILLAQARDPPMVSVFAKEVKKRYKNFVLRKAPRGGIEQPHALEFRFKSLSSARILTDQWGVFFDDHTDFGRQMSGFYPNHKFIDVSPGGLKGWMSRLKEDDFGVKQIYYWPESMHSCTAS